MPRNLLWILATATWLAAITLAALAAASMPTTRAIIGGTAAGLAISGTAVGALAIRLAAPKTEATAIGGRCDGQSFTISARHPPRTIRLASTDGLTCRYKRRGPPGKSPVIYHAE